MTIMKPDECTPGLIHIVYTFLEGYFRYRNIQMNKQEGLIKRNLKKTRGIRPKDYPLRGYKWVAYAVMNVCESNFGTELRSSGLFFLLIGRPYGALQEFLFGFYK